MSARKNDTLRARKNATTCRKNATPSAEQRRAPLDLAAPARNIPMRDAAPSGTRMNGYVRGCIAAALAPAVEGAATSIGRPLVVIVLDPDDPNAATLLPEIAARYAAVAPAGVPSVLMVALGGARSVFSVDHQGPVALMPSTSPGVHVGTA